MTTGGLLDTFGVRPPRRYPPQLPQDPVELADPPLLPEPQPLGTSMVQILFPVLGGVGSLVFILNNPKPLTVVGGLLFLLGSVAMGVAMFVSQRASTSRSARRNRADYLTHVEQAKSQIRAAAHAQDEAESFRHPQPAQLLAVATDLSRRFERRPADSDFLIVRIGVGPVAYLAPLHVRLGNRPGPRQDTVCVAAARRLAEDHASLHGQPLTIEVKAAAAVAFVGDRRAALQACAAAILSLACLHAPEDVTIAACAVPAAMKHWQWLRWLPHARDRLTGRRYLAASIPELEALLTGTTEQMRASSRATGRLRHRLIVLVDTSQLPAAQRLRFAGSGVTVIYVAAEPPDVDVRVQVDRNGNCQISRPREGHRARTGQADQLPPVDAETIARALAAAFRHTPALDRPPMTETPGLASLLGANRLEELLPGSTWRRRSPTEFLRVPLGVGDDGSPVVLDLKESAQSGMGPHGLIVGATGSGKSELLRSLVLGLAVTHPPDRLNVMMVDFKGGATFADLADLPHNAGLITNLQDDLDLVDRAREALSGELRRRQEILKRAGNLPNLVEYNARRDTGQPLPPLPSLLVIIDEFSELLAAKPDFADVFLAVGRIGRSIGVHLLLASQKLELGRVRGLETHLSYRIGLRTFSAAESREAIGTPDAYELPPVPGVGYLKVDTTIYAKFQAPYVSRPHDPDPVGRQPTVRLTFALEPFSAYNPPQQPGVRRPRVAARTGPTELQIVVRALAPAAARAHQIWLPPLAPVITLDQVGVPTPVYRSQQTSLTSPPLAATLGELDQPAEQRKEAFVLDLAGAQGNVAVVGAPQSGKSMLLRTLILSLALSHRPDVAAFYCLDLGGGGLAALADLPHVGSCVDRLDPERLRRTVAEVLNLVNGREQRFRAERIDSAAAMRQRRAAGDLVDELLGDVFLVIDGWGQLRSEFEDLEPLVTEIAARGLGYGIHVILTAGRWAEIRAALQNSVSGRVELKLADPFESLVDRRASDRIARAGSGRGLTSAGLQFQTALPRCDGQARLDDLRDATDKLIADVARTWTGAPVPPIQVLPAHVASASMPLGGTGAGVALGLASTDLKPVYLDLLDAEGHLLVFGDSESGKTNLLRVLAAGLTAQRSAGQLQFVVVDYRRSLLDVVDTQHTLAYAGSAPAATQVLQEVAAGLAKRLPGAEVTSAQLRARTWWSGPDLVVMVDDYDLVADVGRNPLEPLLPYLPQARDVGLHVVLARRSGGAGRAIYEPVLQRLRELRSAGMILSGDRAEGALLGGVTPLPQPPGRGVLIRRRHTPDIVQTCWLPPVE